MDEAVERLIAKVPPPAKPRFQYVDWGGLEAQTSVTYPQHFKDFVAVYGGCVWFDNLSPLYCQAKSKSDVEQFLAHLENLLAPLRDGLDTQNPRTKKWERVSPRVYPEPGGWFPFLVDYGGSVYCWDTTAKNPDQWPAVRCGSGLIDALPYSALQKMILGYLEGESRMKELWGDVAKLPPSRFGLTETEEPSQKQTTKPRGKRKKRS